MFRRILRGLANEKKAPAVLRNHEHHLLFSQPPLEHHHWHQKGQNRSQKTSSEPWPTWQDHCQEAQEQPSERDQWHFDILGISCSGASTNGFDPELGEKRSDNFERLSKQRQSLLEPSFLSDFDCDSFVHSILLSKS